MSRVVLRHALCMYEAVVDGVATGVRHWHEEDALRDAIEILTGAKPEFDIDGVRHVLYVTKIGERKVKRKKETV